MDKDEVIFCQDPLPYTSFLAFQDMREKGELCDLTLKTQHSTIVAHRVVLAAGIPYFRSLFTKETDEAEGKDITIGDLDPNALESLIYFVYTSKLNISGKNVHSLLLTSDFLQLSDVAKACVEFLSERLHVYSVLEVRTVANTINNRQLAECCSTFIQHNFEEFSKSDDFLSLPYDCVKDIISQDELNIPDEETVFETIIKWVRFSRQEREHMLPHLLREIRMTTFSTEYLIKRVATEELIRSSAVCKDLIQDVQYFHLLPEKERDFLNLNTAPRRNRKKEIYTICVSASNGYSVYRCDFTKKTWHNLKSDTSQKEKILHVASSTEHIYVFLVNAIKTFRVNTLEWETLESTHGYLAGSTVFGHLNLIYFFGSLNINFYNKVRIFDTLQKKWLKESEMVNGRANVATASVKETIYVTGGYWDSELFNTAEKYTPSTGEWCQLSPMLASRSLHGCASIDEKIYVFGGCSKKYTPVAYSSSGEMYDPIINQWKSVSPMRSERVGFSLVAYNGKMHAFGGISGAKRPVFEAELYDPKFCEWENSFKVPEGFETAVVI